MKKIALVADTFPPTNTSAAIQLENLSRQLTLDGNKVVVFIPDETIKERIEVSVQSNFEIVKISWARSNQHKKFLKYIINSKGIYNYRWGDALIRYYTVNLLDSKIKELKGCLYKHSGIYDSRNRFQVLLTKSYSKIRNRLYKNIYEKRLSKLDKLFLGVLN